MLLLNVLAGFYTIYGDLTVHWGRNTRFAYGAMLAVCLFFFALGAAMAILNQIEIPRHKAVEHEVSDNLWVFTGVQATGIVMVLGATFGAVSLLLAPGLALDVVVVCYQLLAHAGFVCNVVFMLCGLAFMYMWNKTGRYGTGAGAVRCRNRAGRGERVRVCEVDVRCAALPCVPRLGRSSAGKGGTGAGSGKSKKEKNFVFDVYVLF